MRVFLAATLLVPQLAAADLYRWVDPQSGSVKFSSAPPPWYETERGPKVERIPYQGPAAKPAGADKPAAGGSIAALEARWRDLLRAAAESPADRPQRLKGVEALITELNRADPAGAARRRAEAAATLDKLAPK